MEQKTVGAQTRRLRTCPSVLSFAAVGGRFEGEGPLREYFDELSEDHFFGEKTWEKGESTMQRHALSRALEKGGLKVSDLDLIFAGDLLNQCVGSSFALRESRIPFYGLYGACSTMGESLSLAALMLDGGYASCAAALTSSHFCTAERQYRMPVPYGSQRTPTAQWTATGSGCCLLAREGEGPYITHVTTGKIVDKGVTDANNMGAAMAPAAYDTLCALFCDTRTKPEDYDLIVTGDLGRLGHQIVSDFFARDGLPLGERYTDCGLLLYDIESQDMHCGGSGCGCSASVLCGYLLRGMREGKWNRIIFAPTGALLSPTTTFQGESIPGSRPGCVRSTGCFQLLRGGTGGRGYRRLCLGTLSTGSLLQGGILFAGTVLDHDLFAGVGVGLSVLRHLYILAVRTRHGLYVNAAVADIVNIRKGRGCN